MPIKRFVEDLPTPTRQGNQSRGWAPDAQPRFGHLLAEQWAQEAYPRPRANPDARFRHSDGGACSRAVAYAALDIPASNPMDLAGVWVTELGNLIHEQWQNLLVALYGNEAQVEVKVAAGPDASGHIDAVVSRPVGNRAEPDGSISTQQWISSIEGKSVGGYAYQVAVGCRGPARGPRYTAVVQGALNAKAQDADECVIIYWSRDAISVQMAEDKGIDELGRFVAEWTLPREMYEPIAETELRRVTGIMALLDEGQMPARKIPDPELPTNHLIVRPAAGQWIEYDHEQEPMAVDTGTTWHCAYCRWRDFCDNTQAQRHPIEELPHA